MLLSNHKSLKIHSDVALWPKHKGDVCATDIGMRLFSHWRRYHHNVSIMAKDNHPSRYPSNDDFCGLAANNYTKAVICRWFRRYCGITPTITDDWFLHFPVLTPLLAKWVIANATKKSVRDDSAASYSWADVLDVADGKPIVNTWF